LFLCSAGLIAAVNVPAASQTWTNAPVNSNWSNTNNWVGLAMPGAINMTGNSVNNDVATFNTTIPGSGIGGVTLPITTPNATSTNRSLQIGGVTFDTATCGAYVFQAASSESYPSNGILFVSHNGSITMNAAVTNSETFLVPIFIRLPSSTAGRYNFVNNSTTPTATLVLNTVTNDSAPTRGTVFVLDGANTGANTVAQLSKGTTTSGAMGLTKQGPGTWILPNTNDLASQSVIAVNGGTLKVQNAGSFGAATAATVNSNGTLEIDGVTLSQTRLNLQGQGVIRINGSAMVNAVAVGTATGINASLATTSSSDVMSVLTNSGGAVDSVVHVTGPGTVLLSGAGTYAGNWSFDSGSCQVGTNLALGAGPQASISAGGTLDLTPLGAVTYTWTPVQLGASGTGTGVGSTAATIKADPAGVIDLTTGANGISLTIHPTSFTGDTTHPALYVSQGTLSLANNVFTINNASGSPLGVGTYTLIAQASGSITSGGGYSVAAVSGSGLAANTIGLIQVSGGNLSLVVQSYTAKNLTWKGGNPNNNWDNGTTANWLNGASPSIFTESDNVTFSSTGSATPTVNLVGVLAPGSVTVDTSANTYTLSGGGKIGGSTALTKISAGTLVIQTTNDYSGNTVISNGVIQLGGNNVIPGGTSAGQVVIQSPGTLDLNTFNDTVGALSGNGTVNSTSGGAPVLTIGNNNASGTFSGLIENTSGTVGLTKAGTGTETISGANTYTGPTVVSGGSLRAGNINAFANSTVSVNGGTLDLGSSLVVSNLNGAVGTSIANNASASPVTLFSHGTGTVTSLIADGSGGGAVGIVVLDGALTLNAANSYSGGTVVASGATLNIGVINPGGSGQAGSGGIIASNGAALSMPTAVSTGAGPLNNITTVDGATVTFTSGEAGNSWMGYFIGSATATNIFVNGTASVGTSVAANSIESFSNFLGTVIITNGELRVETGGGGIGGGDNTLFVFVNGGGMFGRDPGTIHLGALSGNGVITAPTTAPTTYLIGGRNASSDFAGGISGTNNIIKTGTGTLMLDGGGQFTTNVTSPDGGLTFVTNVGFGTNMILYTGSTTVSNGVLALAAPSLLTNSTPVILAGATAVLDASAMGYITNQVTTDGSGNTITNQFPVTNSLFEVVSGQTLQGIGTLNGFLQADGGSIFDVGLPTGNFTVSHSAVLAGAVAMNVNAATTPNCGELLATSFTIQPTATLVVSNQGPQQAATFHLFNHPVNFASVTLPPLTGTNSWINNLTVNGSITLVAPQPVPPTPVITSVGLSGTTLNITATNGAPNGTVVLLESTNLATPLPSWVPVLTNAFDTNGNLNLSTNVVNRAVPRQFFILLQ
jgi:autotransporter-associated beta strand protein